MLTLLFVGWASIELTVVCGLGVYWAHYHKQCCGWVFDAEYHNTCWAYTVFLFHYIRNFFSLYFQSALRVAETWVYSPVRLEHHTILSVCEIYFLIHSTALHARTAYLAHTIGWGFKLVGTNLTKKTNKSRLNWSWVVFSVSCKVGW